MPIFINKHNIYILQNNTNKVSNANIYMYTQLHIFFKIILNNTVLVFKIQGLYCPKLIFCKWANLQKRRYCVKG